MPRKSITGAHRKRAPQRESDDSGKLRLLFVEDGDEELEKLRKVLKGSFSFCHVSTGRSASLHIIRDPEIDLVFITMEFESIPEEELLGTEEIIFEKFGNDDDKAIRFLRGNQGAFILHHLRKKVKEPLPVLFSHDFSSELSRWDTLTSRYDNVYYCKREMGPIDIGDFMQTIIQKYRQGKSA